MNTYVRILQIPLKEKNEIEHNTAMQGSSNKNIV